MATTPMDHEDRAAMRAVLELIDRVRHTDTRGTGTQVRATLLDLRDEADRLWARHLRELAVLSVAALVPEGPVAPDLGIADAC